MAHFHRFYPAILSIAAAGFLLAGAAQNPVAAWMGRGADDTASASAEEKQQESKQDSGKQRRGGRRASTSQEDTANSADSITDQKQQGTPVAMPPPFTENNDEQAEHIADKGKSSGSTKRNVVTPELLEQQLEESGVDDLDPLFSDVEEEPSPPLSAEDRNPLVPEPAIVNPPAPLQAPEIAEPTKEIIAKPEVIQANDVPAIIETPVDVPPPGIRQPMARNDREMPKIAEPDPVSAPIMPEPVEAPLIAEPAPVEPSSTEAENEAEEMADGPPLFEMEIGDDELQDDASHSAQSDHPPLPEEKPQVPYDMLRQQRLEEIGAFDKSFRVEAEMEPAVPVQNAPLDTGSLPSSDIVVDADQAKLSRGSKRILKDVPSGISSMPDEDEVPRHVNIDRGDNAGSLFPEEGYEDDSPVGMSMTRETPEAGVEQKLSMAYEALLYGQMESAIAMYQEVLDKDPSNRLGLFGLATAYQRNKQVSQARYVYDRLFKLYPDYSEALNNFLVLVSEEAPEEALAELERLAKRNPRYSPIFAQMGMVHMQQGSLGQASRFLARAISLSPDNVVYRYNLAIVMDQLGDKNEAIALYEQLLNAGEKGAQLPASKAEIQKRLTFLRSSLG